VISLINAVALKYFLLIFYVILNDFDGLGWFWWISSDFVSVAVPT
jgi:hypothetical protein